MQMTVFGVHGKQEGVTARKKLEHLLEFFYAILRQVENAQMRLKEMRNAIVQVSFSGIIYSYAQIKKEIHKESQQLYKTLSMISFLDQGDRCTDHAECSGKKLCKFSPKLGYDICRTGSQIINWLIYTITKITNFYN